MESVRVGVVQMSIEDSVESNLGKIRGYLENGASKGIKLIAFPEMCLTGFNPEVLSDPGLSHLVGGAIRELAGLSRRLGIGALVGHALVEGNVLYNAATVILPNGRRHLYRKMHLTAEEEPYFESGKEIVTFDFNGHRFGLIICRDQNDPSLARRVADDGARALFILSAHLYDPKEARWKIDKNRALPIARAVENGIFVLFSNAVGCHISRVSLGNSLIVDPDGALVAVADEVSETILFYDLPPS